MKKRRAAVTLCCFSMFCCLGFSLLVFAEDVIRESAPEEESAVTEIGPGRVIKDVNGSLRIYPEKGIEDRIEKPFAEPQEEAVEAPEEGNKTDEITDPGRAMRAAAVNHFKAGFEELTNNNFDQAIACFNDAVKFAPEYAQAYAARGKAYAEKNDFAMALEDYNRALTLEPDTAITLILRARALRWIGEYDQAIQDCNKALEIDRHASAAYFNRGLAYYKKGEFDLALDDYTNAISLDFNKEFLKLVYYERAFLYFKKLDYRPALVDLNQSLILDPGYAASYALRAKVYAGQGEYGLAWEDVRHAESLGYTADQEFLKSLQEKSPLH
jgi:tetratricopeptide (TPR) repeat protein